MPGGQVQGGELRVIVILGLTDEHRPGGESPGVDGVQHPPVPASTTYSVPVGTVATAMPSRVGTLPGVESVRLSWVSPGVVCSGWSANTICPSA